MYIFNHLAAKVALLSSPNVHLFQHIFKKYFDLNVVKNG